MSVPLSYVNIETKSCSLSLCLLPRYSHSCSSLIRAPKASASYPPHVKANNPPAFLKGNPLCAVGGYTQVPGPYQQTTHQQSGASLRSCFNECKGAFPKCKSISFHARYTLCLWYDQIVEKTQLVPDKDSEFLHWDLECYLTASGTKREEVAWKV